MYKIKDYVVYNKNVCEITDISKSKYNNEDCYILSMIGDRSLKISLPVNKTTLLRNIITKDEITKLINEIPSIKVIDKDDKSIETEYKNLLKSGTAEDLITIIKTTYFRNKQRLDNNKKISDKDNNYYLKAENYLYNEISVALGKTYEETKEYIINANKEMEKLNG